MEQAPSDAGPSDRVRTCGLMVPNHPRYQLRYTRICLLFRAPHRERLVIIVYFAPACKSFLVRFPGLFLVRFPGLLSLMFGGSCGIV